MSESSKNLLKTFKAKQSEKDSSQLQEARRLVNLYRSISCFGDDFVEQYNRMLLDVKPNVRRLLRNFMGGEEVEAYLQFLEQTIHLSREGSEQKNVMDTQIKGYLPDPSADKALFPSNGNVTVSRSEWEKMKEQTQTLLKRLVKLEHLLETKKASYDNYSEIIEESREKAHE